jgi:hypothetical protein
MNDIHPYIRGGDVLYSSFDMHKYVLIFYEDLVEGQVKQ